jgi:hypothetical protein
MYNVGKELDTFWLGWTRKGTAVTCSLREPPALAITSAARGAQGSLLLAG